MTTSTNTFDLQSSNQPANVRITIETNEQRKSTHPGPSPKFHIREDEKKNIFRDERKLVRESHHHSPFTQNQNVLYITTIQSEHRNRETNEENFYSFLSIFVIRTKEGWKRNDGSLCLLLYVLCGGHDEKRKNKKGEI